MNNIDKANFITRQFKRTHNKRFENYCLTRIWHGINSIDVKMVTQQYVIRDNGCALLDAYFPQFNIGIEVDECQHKIEYNIKADKKREKDVVRAIGCKIFRIDVTVDLEEINRQCDDVIREIKKYMGEVKFEPWNLEKEYSPDKYIKKGSISIDDNAAFRKMTDVLECFGIYYKAFQQGGCNHPTDKDVLIWFPKMYARKEWINVINENEDIIYEMNENEEKNRDYVDVWINTKRKKRYVFVYTKDSLGMVLYRFKGIFKLDENATKKENKAVWTRTGDTVKTIENVLKGSK